MFRHKGKGRTFSHNLKLASILSSVAGIVNITGVLALKTLTTNVTGHFAFFSEEFLQSHYEMALIYLLYILFFLFGAFTSSFLMEWFSKFKASGSYAVPLLLEIFLLTGVGAFPFIYPDVNPFSVIYLSYTLLFAMGLQNALVTRVSQSVVRTTHLTGLFTDLGIELSQLFFYRKTADRSRLNRSIFLKIMIISCFFIGGVVGGFTYLHLHLKTLFLAVGLLIFALWYDRLLFRYYYLKRKFRQHGR